MSFSGHGGRLHVAEANAALVDLCMDAGVNFFDTADVYSQGLSEEILGEAIRHLPARKRFYFDQGDLSIWGRTPTILVRRRAHLSRQIEGRLKRLKTEITSTCITCMGSMLCTPDGRDFEYAGHVCARRQGAVYRGVKFFGMASPEIDWHQRTVRDGPRYVAHQVYYSLIGRDYEWELMPQAHSQGLGALVWSPLGWGTAYGEDSPGRAEAGDQPIA